MNTPRGFSTGYRDVDAYLQWRRKTRRLRKYGGPLLALLFMILAVVLIKQMNKPRDDLDSPPAKSSKRYRSVQ